MIKKVLLSGPYFPRHEENLMASEGALQMAREKFLASRFRNLDKLLRVRYEWMNQYLLPGYCIFEIGSGAGFSPLYLNPRPILTDVIENSWLDKVIDATNMDLADSSVDVLIAQHTIHHFHSPFKFFRECHRVLKVNGVLLIQEINTSLLMRMLLRLMRHEGWCYDVNVFDERGVVNDKADPWSANCAIPEILFDDVTQFEKTFAGMKVELNELCECLIFPLSGGVISKIKVPEMPDLLCEFVLLLDEKLVKLSPSLFALGRRVVIRKRT